ncbi:MAG: hypothetical protein HY264_10480 [Chloroflexi bacterium]|nr:hypothetical protein [Chloroflexota bacterium]
MDRSAAGRTLVILVAAVLLGGCGGSAGGSPAASPLNLTAVTDALARAGFAVVDVADNLDPREGAWRCLPGSFRLARISQEPPGALARPGAKPSVDILLFSSEGARATAQAAIGADGQVRAQGCGVLVDWVATPHVVAARNILLVVATDDPATLTAVKAAATRLGG